MKHLWMLLLCLVALRSEAQQVPFFVGTYTDKGSQGIYLYMLDLKDGSAELYATTVSDNPSFVVKSLDGNRVYAVNETGDETASLSTYTFDGDNLSFVNSLPTQGTYPCHVAVSPKDPLVVVSNYGGGSATVYNLDEDGELDQQVQLLQHSGGGPVKGRQDEAHVHSAFFTPDAKHVYIQDLGSDRITIYAVRKEDGIYKLQEEGTINTPAGGGPRHIAFDKKAKNLYVLLELTGEVVHYKKEDNNWELLKVSSINEEGFSGANGAAEIRLSDDGHFLYASNRGDANSIALFAVDKHGELDLKKVYSTRGKGPRNFNFSPDGNYLLVANQTTDNIVVFKRDSKTGELSATDQEIHVATPVCIAF